MSDVVRSMMSVQRVAVVVSQLGVWAATRVGMPHSAARPDIATVGALFMAAGLALNLLGWRFLVKPGPKSREEQFSLRLSGGALCAMGGVLIGVFSGHPGWAGPGVALGVALTLFTPIPPIDDAAPIEL